MLKSRSWLTLITGILFVVVSIMMVFNPLLNMAILGLFITVSILIDGVIGVADFLSRPKGQRSFWMLLLSILTIIVSFVLLGDTLAEQAALVPVMFAVWMIFVGVSRIMMAILEGEILGRKAVTFLLVTGIIALLLSAFVFAQPLFSGLVITYAIAIAFCAFGIFRIIEFFSRA